MRLYLFVILVIEVRKKGKYERLVDSFVYWSGNGGGIEWYLCRSVGEEVFGDFYFGRFFGGCR